MDELSKEESFKALLMREVDIDNKKRSLYLANLVKSHGRNCRSDINNWITPKQMYSSLIKII